jgi:hypothetical protein
MKRIFPTGWPELVEIEARAGELLMQAASDEEDHVAKRALLIEADTSLQSAKTALAISGGANHPYVKHLDFKATCSAKAAARIEVPL